nr:hypothetical protein Iba_chr05aCG6770 [Ipomoea batatas]
MRTPLEEAAHRMRRTPLEEATHWMRLNLKLEACEKHVKLEAFEKPPATSSSLSSQPASSHRRALSSPSTQPHSPPILSPNDSIFSESAAPSTNDPAPSSSSLPATPERFVKVTDWNSM